LLAAGLRQEAQAAMAGGAGQDENVLWDEALDWHRRVLAAPGDAELAAALNLWRGSDRRCDAIYAQVEMIWGLSGALPPAFPDPEVAARRLAEPARLVGASPQRPVNPPRRGWAGYAGYGIAAALAAALLISIVGPAALLRLKADHLTAVGERHRIVLEEGSVVVLNTDSAIAVNFSSSAREIVLLKGEAFFTVAPDRTARPFVVHGDGLRVVDIGTAFDVALGAADLSVAVQSGIVDASWGTDARPTQRRLTVGDRLRIDRRNGQARADLVDPLSIAAWRNDQLIVEDATVADVVAELQRHFRGFVVVRNEALARKRLTGIYDLKDPAAALQAVVGPYAGTVRAITPFLLIVS
jgi:transmembrane sensor